MWGDEKVSQLLTDLADYIKQEVLNKPAYYMGTILLHSDENRRAVFVIDGQQRLTTLAVIYHIINGQLPSNFNFKFNSDISVKNIQNTQKYCKKAGSLDFDFTQIKFTCVTVENEDLAFTFFDTQNTRGVPLAATDLLKAYHLRSINNSMAGSETTQKYSAQRWESIQRIGNGSDFAQRLFGPFLWRARNWRGGSVKVRKSHEAILETFQKNTLRGLNLQEIPLYANSSNQWARSIILTAKNSFRLNLKPVSLEEDASNLPFAIRQPIHDGVGFFLYAEKYAALLRDLQTEPAEDKGERANFYTLYKEVMEKSRLSGYLRNLFWVAVLMYVDQFGEKGLTLFAEALNYSLGALRIEKASIMKETPVKYLRDRDHNLLDIIAGAYRPEEITDFLFGDEYAKKIYAREDIDQLTSIGVRKYYAEAVRAYYGNKADWQNRGKWTRRECN